jgi:hypothetical protein
MTSIGCFALFETVPRGKRYAAMVMSRDGHVANLAWHTENMYVTGEAPDSAMFTRSVRDCTEAIEDAFMNALPRTKVSSYMYSDNLAY